MDNYALTAINILKELQPKFPWQRNSITGEEIEHLVTAHYVKKFEEDWNRDKERALYKIYRNIQQWMLKTKLSETINPEDRGCTNCHSHNFPASDVEAEIIIDYCKSYKIPISKDAVISQYYLQYPMVSKKSSNCAFNQNGKCEIYHMRPIACRIAPYIKDKSLSSIPTDKVGIDSPFFHDVCMNTYLASVLAIIHADNKPLAGYILRKMQ